MANVSSSNSQKALVPKLRFPGFDGEWRMARFGDITEINPKTPPIPDKFHYIDLESVESGMLIKDVIVDRTTAPSRAQRVLQLNDILFQTVRPYQMNNFFFRAEMNIPSVASTGYAQIRTEEEPQFIYELLHSSSFNNEVLVRCTGSSYPAVNSYDLKEIVVCIPYREEQKKVASFLELLDERIDKQKRFVAALKLYKRGVASALFSQKLRLKQPDGSDYAPWSQIHLGSVFCERTERGLGTETLLAVTISNGVQIRAELDLKDNSSDDKQNYRLVRIDDLAYNTMRMWQGACGVSAYEGIVSPAYTVLYARDPQVTHTPFWAYLFKEPQMLHVFQRNSQGLTSDTWNLKYDKFSRIVVDAPSVHEQRHICKVLDAMTVAIHKQEASLNLLSEIKRGLLAIMFI